MTKLSDDGRDFFWQVRDTLANHLPFSPGAESISNVYKSRIKFKRDGKVYVVTIEEKK
jgi:hypothetical protein